jgi:hypothetical protein
LLDTVLTLARNEALREFLELLAGLCMLGAALGVLVDHVPGVVHEQAVFLLLIFGKTRELEDVVGFEKLLGLLGGPGRLGLGGAHLLG